MYHAGNGQRFWSNDFAMDRVDTKPVIQMGGETDYERERAQQIMSNRKLLEDVGLGDMGGSVSNHHPAIISTDPQ
jgi:hypothetical protein